MYSSILIAKNSGKAIYKTKSLYTDEWWVEISGKKKYFITNFSNQHYWFLCNQCYWFIYEKCLLLKYKMGLTGCKISFKIQPTLVIKKRIYGICFYHFLFDSVEGRLQNLICNTKFFFCPDNFCFFNLPLK